MEKYINKDTVIEDEIFELFKSSVICPLCKNIYINPLLCTKCQNTFCKKCLDIWSQNNNEICPNNCEEPVYVKSLGRNDILSKLKFICVGCENEILYEKAENHHNLCCPDKTSENQSFQRIKNKNLRLEELMPEEIAIFKKQNLKILNIYCKL